MIDLRYIVKVTKMNQYDTNNIPYSNTVYDGTNPERAREKFLMYSQWGGAKIEAKRELND